MGDLAMPRLVHRNPKYRKHRATGEAVVTLNDRDIYLGPYNTKAARGELKVSRLKVTTG
jgi:hypothetical protein